MSDAELRRAERDAAQNPSHANRLRLLRARRRAGLAVSEPPPDLRGRHAVFLGAFSDWIDRRRTPAQTWVDCGGVVDDTLTDTTEVLVVGPKRAAGKAAALRLARTRNLEVLDPDAFLRWVRPPLADQRVALLGGFKLFPKAPAPGHPAELLEACDATLTDDLADATLVVLGSGRAAGKTAALRTLAARTPPPRIVPEELLLQAIALETAARSDVPTDPVARLTTLHRSLDRKRLQRAVKLQQDVLAHHLGPQHLLGLVAGSERYAVFLTHDGDFCCGFRPGYGDDEPVTCWGQQPHTPCKHLLALILRITHDQPELLETLVPWVERALPKTPQLDASLLEEAFALPSS